MIRPIYMFRYWFRVTEKFGTSTATGDREKVLDMTKPLFRVDEILDMAIQIEHQGLAFYQACKKEDLGPDIEAVLDYLIEQEQRHVRVFTRMKEGHESNPVPESYTGEMDRYVEAFVKDKVFHRPGRAVEEAKQISGPLQAVDWGVSFERRSIEFYRSMKGIVRATEQKRIDAIITEEQNHIRRLSQVAARLKGDESS